jgi:hypothetical protein
MINHLKLPSLKDRLTSGATKEVKPKKAKKGIVAKVKDAVKRVRGKK